MRLSSCLTVILAAVLVGITLIPKKFLMHLESATLAEINGMTLEKFEKVIFIEDLKETGYVMKYYQIAQAEQERTGIPASIKLAQGLLESQGGTSDIAKTINNHFGIKCSVNSQWWHDHCRGCSCKSIWSDSKTDMFRIFESVEESYEEHSRLLLSLSRYRKLLKFGTDYVQWAHGLQEAGYAGDPNYAKKLIQIIEEKKLYLYDNSTGQNGDDTSERDPGG